MSINLKNCFVAAVGFVSPSYSLRLSEKFEVIEAYKGAIRRREIDRKEGVDDDAVIDALDSAEGAVRDLGVPFSWSRFCI